MHASPRGTNVIGFGSAGWPSIGGSPRSLVEGLPRRLSLSSSQLIEPLDNWRAVTAERHVSPYRFSRFHIGYTHHMPDRKAFSSKAVSFAVGAITALATRRALTMLWDRIAEIPAPKEAADRRIAWTPALSWAIATGV